MMVSRGALLRLAALAFALLFALPGCVSYDTSGPLFKPAPPADGHGVVYVMRTRSQFGMLQSIKAERQANVQALSTRRAAVQAEVSRITTQQISNPTVAAEQARINRDYDVLKQQ